MYSVNTSTTIKMPYIHELLTHKKTKCTGGVRVVFSIARIRSSNSDRMNKSNFTTETINHVVYI